MSAVELLKRATRRVCEEAGEPWSEDNDAEFEGPEVARFADTFAELVLAEHTAELEQENRLMRARMERLQAERTTLVEAICTRIGQACGHNSVAEMAVRLDFMPKRPCVVHVPSCDTEGGAI